MILYNKKFLWPLVSTVVALLPQFFAYGGTSFVPGSTATIPNPLGTETDTIVKFLNLLLDTLFPIMSIVAIFFLIFSGFLMVTAGGNEEKLSKARQAFLWTVIGVAILLGAKVLSAVICGTVNQLSNTHLSCPAN